MTPIYRYCDFGRQLSLERLWTYVSLLWSAGIVPLSRAVKRDDDGLMMAFPTPLMASVTHHGHGGSAKIDSHANASIKIGLTGHIIQLSSHLILFL